MTKVNRWLGFGLVAGILVTGAVQAQQAPEGLASDKLAKVALSALRPCGETGDMSVKAAPCDEAPARLAPRPAGAGPTAQPAGTDAEAFPEVPQTGADTGSLGWLDEMAKLDAQIQLLQKRQELELMLNTRAEVAAAALPQVATVAGFNGRFVAELVFPNGRVARHRKGDQLAQDVVISKLDGDGVFVDMLVDGQERKAVQLSFAAPDAETAQASAVALSALAPAAPDVAPAAPTAPAAP